MIKRCALHCGIAMLVSMALTTSASASLLRMRIENLTTGNGVVLTDNQPGDGSSANGVLLFNGTIDGTTISISTGAGSPPLFAHGTASPAIDLNTITIAGAAANLVFTLEQADFAIPSPNVHLVSSIGGTLAAAPGSTVTANGYADPTNAVPTLGPDQAASGPVNAPHPPAIPGTAVGTPTQGPFGNGPFSSVTSTNFTHSGSYSLFIQDRVNFTGGGSVSFDHLLESVPETSSVVGFSSLIGMGGLGLLRFRKRNSKTAA